MLKQKTFILIVLIFMMLSALVPGAEACSCGGTFEGLQPCQEYWNTDAAFVGQVSDISIIPLDLGDGRSGYRQKLVRFTLGESFRGVEGHTVEVLTGMGGGDCGYDFKQGEQYFVYARRNPKDDKLYTGICGRTRPLSKATADVEYARAVAKGNTGSIIFGVVLRYTRGSYQDYGNHKGIEGIPVSIEGNNKKFNLFTNNEGRFQLDGLPAGNYKVRAELPETLPQPSEREVVVAERRCAGVAFLTTSLGSITGRLLDSDERPISKITVYLIPADTGGEEKLWKGREIRSYTNDQGHYSFSQIPPGQYVIVVNYEGQPGQFDPPFPRTYHPGTNDLTQAAGFTISEGQEIKASDFRLPPRLVERTIEGVVEWPDGQPVAGATVGLEFTERRWMEQLKSTDKQGRFSLQCLEGYRYLIHAEQGDNQKRMHAEPLAVLVTGDNGPVKLVITKPGRAPYYNSNKQKER